MHYAPNISNEDIGGTKPGMGSYPFTVLNGPHGFTIQHLGKTETAAITKAHQEMLAGLCKIEQTWCLPASQGH
jgi:hypothetical protein